MKIWINIVRILMIMTVVFSVDKLNLDHLEWSVNSTAYLGLTAAIILGMTYQILQRQMRKDETVK